MRLENFGQLRLERINARAIDQARTSSTVGAPGGRECLCVCTDQPTRERGLLIR